MQPADYDYYQFHDDIVENGNVLDENLNNNIGANNQKPTIGCCCGGRGHGRKFMWPTIEVRIDNVKYRIGAYAAGDVRNTLSTDEGNNIGDEKQE